MQEDISRLYNGEEILNSSNLYDFNYIAGVYFDKANKCPLIFINITEHKFFFVNPANPNDTNEAIFFERLK